VILYCLEQDGVVGGEPPASSGVPAFRFDAGEDFLSYTGSDRWVSREMMVHEVARRLATGEHCVTLIEEGILVHWGWIQLGLKEIHMREVDFVYPLPPGSATTYGVYTEPPFRGRGLHRRGAAVRACWAFELGAERIFTHVFEGNVPSRRAKEAAGYRPVARIVCVRRLGRRRSRAEPIC